MHAGLLACFLSLWHNSDDHGELSFRIHDACDEAGPAAPLSWLSQWLTVYAACAMPSESQGADQEVNAPRALMAP